MAYGDSVEPFGLDYTGRATYLAWTQAVAGKGGLAVRLGGHGYDADGRTVADMSADGILGERYPASVIAAQGMAAPFWWSNGQQYGYYLAPRAVRVLDLIHTVQDESAIAAGRTAETAQNIATGLVGLGGLAGLALLAVAFLALRKK